MEADTVLGSGRENYKLTLIHDNKNWYSTRLKNTFLKEEFPPLLLVLAYNFDGTLTERVEYDDSSDYTSNKRRQSTSPILLIQCLMLKTHGNTII